MIDPLSADQLRQICDIEKFDFETTADLDSEVHIIGQPRGIRAIEFGVDVSSPGYNILRAWRGGYWPDHSNSKLY